MAKARKTHPTTNRQADTVIMATATGLVSGGGDDERQSTLRDASPNAMAGARALI